MTKSDKETLLRYVVAEGKRARASGYCVPVHMSSGIALGLIANLQLALRHPGNTGETAEIARHVVAEMIERLRSDGYPAHAELAELGNDPNEDI